MNDQIKLYQFYCDSCHYKNITDGSDVSNMKEVKTSKVQGSIPKLDKLSKKTIPSQWYKRKKRYKCPNCGKTISPKLLTTVRHPMEKAKEELEDQEEIIQNIIQQLENHGEDNTFGY